MGNVELIRRWLADARELKQEAVLAGDYDGFKAAEQDEKNYLVMLEAWQSDDAV